MDPLNATLKEFAADGYSHVEANVPHCRVIRLRPIDRLPKTSMGLTLDALARSQRPNSGREQGPGFVAAIVGP